MSKALTIKQPSIFKGNYEVYDSGVLVASLKVKGLSKMKGLATINGQVWELARQDKFKRNIIAKSSGVNSPVLTFQADLLRASGHIQIANKQYFYKRIIDKIPGHTIRSAAYVWLNSAQNEVITLRLDGFLQRSGTVIVADEEIANKNYLMLILLWLFRLKLEGRSNNVS